MWVTIGDADYPYVVFDFTADYTATGPTTFLAGYRGYLQADAWAHYEGLYGDDRVKHICDWAPARRKFVAAVEGGDARAEVPLELSANCTSSSASCRRCCCRPRNWPSKSSVASAKSSGGTCGKGMPIRSWPN